MIDLRCPRCGTEHHAGEEHLGKALRCSRCGDPIQILRQGVPRDSSEAADAAAKGRVAVAGRNVNMDRGRFRAGASHWSRARILAIAACAIVAVLGCLFYLHARRSIQQGANDGGMQVHTFGSESQTPASAAPAQQPAVGDVASGTGYLPSAAPRQGVGTTADAQSSQLGGGFRTPAKSGGPWGDNEPRNRIPAPRDVGADLAIPVRSMVAFVEEPDASAATIRKVSERDTLVLIDREPRNGWYDVIDVRSGREGWVNQNDVEIIFTKHPEASAKFSEEYLGSDAAPKVDVVNQTSDSLDLKVGQTYYTVQPKSQISVPIPAGTFSYYATEPGVIPAMGKQEFKRGYGYTWTFWVETHVVELP